MEKTVVIVAGNSLSAAYGGVQVALDAKGTKHGSNPTSIHKTLWTNSVEAVTEYCRVIFDLFPDEYQVCVAAADEVKCHPINTWRDEDQELSKVQSGFQKFGFPVLNPPIAPPHHQCNHMTSVLQGLQFGMRCLAQLTATQYALSVNMGPVRRSLNNTGRIVIFCTLDRLADIKEVEKTSLNLLRAENLDIKQKHDPARLPIQKCEVVIVNVHGSGAQCQITESPARNIASDVSISVYSYPANQLIVKTLDLVKYQYGLKSTIITNIPMKEEQSGGSSFNYDVELIHMAEAHRDIFRAGYEIGSNNNQSSDKSSHDEPIILRWSTPKSIPLDLHYCSSIYRVTPADVISRPTVCLINFVLSGKPVLFEQPRRNSTTKLISHSLTCHGGSIFLRCLPEGRSYLDDPPSISEGWGGRITDYRISDFSGLIQDNMLAPHPVERTKIPAVYPLQMAKNNLERMTRHWPLIFSDTVAYSMIQELDPLLNVIHYQTLSDREVELCKSVIVNLQRKENNSEPLPIPSSGTRTRGSNKRDEQYSSLWNELECIANKYSNMSDNHKVLCDYICSAAGQSPSTQNAKMMDVVNKKEETMEVTTARAPPPPPADEKFNISKPDHSLASVKPGHHRKTPYPIPAKPVASLLSIWTTKLNAKASAEHPEFKGRLSSQSNKADLYGYMRNGNDRMMSLADQDM